ncbi:MAG: hypothetical protein NTX03_08955 [Bacteroidetes bacterium]|nr:hypothetical protein [Bacteroidota bacterium]
MANSQNIITNGLSGMVGHVLVFTSRGGKTIVKAAPKKSKKPPTAGMTAAREKFQQATFYGKGAIADPATKAEYQTGVDANLNSAYIVAVADFQNAPHIELVDFTNYNGNPGSFIMVRAIDDFKVTRVKVRIENADGTLVEEGDAIQQPDILDWKYNATLANISLAGDKIIVTAYDKAGNTDLKNQPI